MKLSVIILNYNVRYFLELCIKSVQAATQHLDAEIIVVDNNSKDDSCAMVKSVFPDVKLIENKDNSGFSKGNNIGVAQAKGEYLCILNPDTVVGEDTFTSLLTYADSLSNLGIVGCQLIDGRGRFLPESKRNVPTPLVAMKKTLGISDSYYVSDLEASGVGKVDVFVGAFMLLKKTVYIEVGGFDEDYFMYGEDVDLSYKILKAGYTNYYNGQIKVIHYKGESTLKDSNYAKHFYGAMQIFYKKHFKSNVFFDALVWMGIKLAKYTSDPTDDLGATSERYLIISDREALSWTASLELPFTVQPTIETVISGTTVVFDAENCDYAKLIHTMHLHHNEQGVCYKIKPKGSSFLIGSNSSKSRGEVIYL